MAAGNTYTPIATTTLGSAAASYTFSSISGSYTDLVLVFAGTVTTAGNNLGLRFNSDAGSNYSTTFLEGSGTTATSNRTTGSTIISTGYQIGIGDSQSNVIWNIMNYANSTTYKTALLRVNAPTSSAYPGVGTEVGLWRNTNAITSITIVNVSSNISAGSTFSLYGIAAA